MKKFLILFLAIVGFAITANAQNVVIQQNGTTTSNTQTSDPNIFYINGIPSTADIGGVETEIKYPSYDTDNISLILTNYNAETVTVLYYVETSRGSERSGSVVLKPEQHKYVNLAVSVWNNGRISKIATITRKL